MDANNILTKSKLPNKCFDINNICRNQQYLEMLSPKIVVNTKVGLKKYYSLWRMSINKNVLHCYEV